MDIKAELIAAIKDEMYEFIVGDGAIEYPHNMALDKAIDLIHTLIPDGCVIVPEAKLKYLNEHHAISEMWIGAARLELKHCHIDKAIDALEAACTGIDAAEKAMRATNKGAGE